MGLYLAPLAEKFILQKLVKADCFAAWGHGRVKFRPGNSTIGSTQSHESRVGIKPPRMGSFESAVSGRLGESGKCSEEKSRFVVAHLRELYAALRELRYRRKIPSIKVPGVS